MQNLPDALAPMAAYDQFILYKLVPSKTTPGKMDKLPVDHRTLSVFVKDQNWQDDSNAWTSAANATNLVSLCGDEFGVGFFFTKNDPFFFVDIDKCLEPGGAAWSPVALDLMARLDGAAVEVSQSGNGLHIFGQGACPDHACKNIPLGLELYTERRFVALTGTNAIGSSDLDCTTALTSLVTGFFPPTVAVNPTEWSDKPVEKWNGIVDDEKLIKKALASKSAASAFGAKATFADLWKRNIDVLSDVYAPDTSDTGEFDESQADAALAQHLAFWTGNDCERILRLMDQSALARDKWISHNSYLRNTIIRAVSLQEMVYTGNKKDEPPRIPVEPVADVIGTMEGPEILTGYQFLGVTQQIEHFKGCVYIQDVHKVFTAKGSQLKSEQFNATYGGYVFQLDSDGSGKITRKAWEAFTESQAVRYPKSESSTFRPDLPQGDLINEEGRTLVNTYVPINTPRKKGDITPFVEHLAKILPDAHDREILLAYMAACIQYKGVKFQWAPLLQGAPGNGKTLFTRCVEFAIGERYTHQPRADQIDEKFNEWLFDKIFIGVEDIYVPDHKLEVIEALKPMITNDRLAKRAMQTGQIMHRVCCNFILNSNHKNGIRKTRNDRRFAVFFTAQQSVDDLTRDGMSGDYFPDLYRWLKNKDGYAMVAEYLETYPIPNELNPATSCHRAPATSSTDEAIHASIGTVEQEIIEAIEEGRPGFAGGWISSIMLDRLLQQLHMTRAIPRNKRRDVLVDLGYDWHPHLNEGRVNNSIIAPDAGKPRLFLKKDHLASNIEGCANIVEAYQKAQLAPGTYVSPAEKAFKS